MKRWWRKDPAPTPKPDKLERKALDDLNSAVPRPAPFQRKQDTGIVVHETFGELVVATTAPVKVAIYCGNRSCRRRHFEPLESYGDNPIYTCPRCNTTNVKRPLRALLGKNPPDAIDGLWGQLPPRRKPSDRMS